MKYVDSRIVDTLKRNHNCCLDLSELVHQVGDSNETKTECWCL